MGLLAALFHVKLWAMPDPEQNFELAHPLFPIDEDAANAPTPAVHFIQVVRHDAGQKYTAPRLFKADELTSLIQLVDLYGGGKYEVVARDQTNSRITARRTYVIEGESKPLVEAKSAKPKAAVPDEMAALLAMVKAQQQPAPSGFNMQSFMAFAAVVAPVLAQWLNNQATAAQASVLAQQNLMATVMTTATQSSDKLVAAMAQIYNARPPQTGGEGGSFQDGMKFMQDFIIGQNEGKAEGADEPSLKDMFGLAQAYLESQKGPPAVGSGGGTSGGSEGGAA